MTALLDILAYIINIIKEVTESIEQEIGLTRIFFCIGVGEDTDTLMLDMHIDVGASHDGVAVVVDGTLLLTVYMQLLCAEGLDFRVVAEGFHKEIGSYLRCFKGVEWFHDDHIHLTVFHRGAGSNVGVVAVL